MNRAICWTVPWLFQFALLVCGCPAVRAGSSKAYLDHLAETFDRAKLQSGLIRCRVVTDTPKEESVFLIFKNDRYLKRSEVQTGNQTRVTCQWFDGLHAVYGARDQNWRFVIQEPRPATTEFPMMFLGEVFQYWGKSDSAFRNLDPAGERGFNEGMEFTYVNRDSKARMVIIAGPSDNQLPVSITCYDSNGTVFAMWRYDKWTEREGAVWFPSSCTFEKHWSFPNEKTVRSQTLTYTITEARFNMDVSDAWIMPQFPAGSSVQDNVSNPKACLLYPEFDFLADFKDPVTVPVKRPGESP